MAKQVQFRGGTTAQHSVFTGANREITVDTDKDTLVVHDGATVGGFPLARESVINTALDTKVNKNANITASTNTKITYDVKGLVTGSTTLAATDIPSLDASKVTTGILPVLRGGTGVSTSTGTGSVVLSTSPSLSTPNIGVASGTSFNSITGLSSVAPLASGTAAVGTSTLTARQDHVHPIQTTISGNAGTSTTLATPRLINGTSFNGSADITVPVNTTQKSDSVSYNIPFVSNIVAGNQNLYTDSVSSLTYNPSTNELSTTTFVGSLTGNASTATTADTATTANTAIILATARTISGVSFNGSANINIEDRLGTSIASATTTTVGTAGLGDYMHITGVATITSLGTAASAGIRRTLIFDEALTLTHNATSLICPGAANIVTVAGTIIEVIAETTANWRVVSVTHPSIGMAELGYLNGVTSAIQTQINLKAPLASPALTGTPTAPTAVIATNNTQVATTAFAKLASDPINSLRSDRYLALQNIATMIYTSENLTKIQYNNATDVNYEVLTYDINGNLTTIQHYVGSVLKGTTTLSYTSGNLVSAIFAGV